MNLKNKVVVITGASKGLGKAMAQAFIDEKVKVVISARLKKALQAASRATGTIPFVADVTKEADMNKLAQFAVKKFGSIDIWVNNAGTWMPHADIEKVDVKKAHQLMEVNFFGTFYGSRAAIRVMKKKKHGAIVNIISNSSLVGRSRSSVYASSKWAARGFTESLRLALKPYRIPVFAVHPGGMKTDIFGKHRPKDYDKWMEPSSVAKKIVQNLKSKKPKLEMVIWRPK